MSNTDGLMYSCNGTLVVRINNANLSPVSDTGLFRMVNGYYFQGKFSFVGPLMTSELSSIALNWGNKKKYGCDSHH